MIERGFLDASGERISAPKWDQCNVCRRKFPTWRELLGHKAQKHGLVLPAVTASLSSSLDPQRPPVRIPGS